MFYTSAKYLYYCELKMKRPKYDRFFLHSDTFCWNNSMSLIEVKTRPKTISFTIVLLFAIAFGVTNRITIRVAAERAIVFQSSDRPAFADSASLKLSLMPKAASPNFQTIRPTSTQRQVDVLIEYFTSTKKRDYPMPNEPITLQAEGRVFNAVTNSKGFARFNDIPCGKQIEITFTGKPRASFSRSLNCQGQLKKWRYYFNPYKEFDSSAIEQVQ
jgi:hypothetical protein